MNDDGVIGCALTDTDSNNFVPMTILTPRMIDIDARMTELWKIAGCSVEKKNNPNNARWKRLYEK